MKYFFYIAVASFFLSSDVRVVMSMEDSRIALHDTPLQFQDEGLAGAQMLSVAQNPGQLNHILFSAIYRNDWHNVILWFKAAQQLEDQAVGEQVKHAMQQQFSLKNHKDLIAELLNGGNVHDAIAWHVGMLDADQQAIALSIFKDYIDQYIKRQNAAALSELTCLFTDAIHSAMYQKINEAIKKIYGKLHAESSCASVGMNEPEVQRLSMVQPTLSQPASFDLPSVKTIQKVTNQQEQQNFFFWMPIDIRNAIVECLLKHHSETIMKKIAKSPCFKGIAVQRSNHLSMGTLYFPTDTLEFEGFSICLNKQGDLLFKKKHKSFFANLLQRPRLLFKNDPKSNIEITIPDAIVRGTPSITAASLSSNKTFLVLLATIDNEICYPVALHIINLLQPDAPPKKILLESLITSQGSCWARNCIITNRGDQANHTALIQAGYAWPVNSDLNRLFDKRKQLVMYNDITSIAISDSGKLVAIADRTGIMLLDVNKNSVKKIVTERYAEDFSCPYQMWLDELTDNLYYKPSSKVAVKMVPLEIQRDVDQDRLQTFFESCGVCKILPKYTDTQNI